MGSAAHPAPQINQVQYTELNDGSYCSDKFGRPIGFCRFIFSIGHGGGPVKMPAMRTEKFWDIAHENSAALETPPARHPCIIQGVNQPLRCLIFDRLRRFLRPSLRRPLPDFFTPIQQQLPEYQSFDCPALLTDSRGRSPDSNGRYSPTQCVANIASTRGANPKTQTDRKSVV